MTKTEKAMFAELRSLDVALQTKKRLLATLRVDYIHEQNPQVATKKLRLWDREMDVYRKLNACKIQWTRNFLSLMEKC